MSKLSEISRKASALKNKGVKIAQSTWDKYVETLAAASDKAAEQMERFVRNLDNYGGIDAYTDAVVDYAYALATKYGEATAAAACDMYDAITEASGVVLPAAEPAATATYAETRKAIEGAAKFSRKPEYIASVSGRLVKQAGADTTLKNAKRDGAQFAWIPHGDTCAFCITLASRGWQPASQIALNGGHAEHIHSNCDCTYAIRFNSKSYVEGYQPEKYLEMYENAEGNDSAHKIDALRRQFYAENREKINAQKRAAYATRRELNSSAAEEFNVND